MAIPFLSDIILRQGTKIQFKTDAGADAGIIDIDSSGNLVLSNTAGDILLGDGASDVYIGDGTNNVDIIFEQSGSIKGDGSAVTLTLGGANTTLNLENPNFTGNITMSSKLKFTTSNGFILFDYEPSGDTGEYTTEVPLLKVQHDAGGGESTILARVSEYRAVVLGVDDTVWLRAGDTGSVIKANVGLTTEQVLMSAEGGFHAYGFPGNDTTWSNRVEFKFRTDSTTASDNGLYIGDGGNTQFIDLSRNLKNIGTISNTGDVTITNGNVIFSSQYGVRFNDANTRIYTNTDSPEDLLVEADQDILLTPDRYVGVNTTAPASVLHVNTGSGTQNSNTVIIDRAGSSDYSGVSFATAGTVDWSIGQNSAGTFEVYEDGQDAQTRLTIASGGSLGVGAASPQEKLHVYHAGTARVEVEGTSGPAAFKATNTQGSFGWYIPSDANEFRLWNFGTSADLVTIDSSGKVGIGTAPAAGVELHVNGEIRVDSTSGVATRKIRSGYFSSTTDIVVASGSSANVRLQNGTTDGLVIDSSQNATFSGAINLDSSHINIDGNGAVIFDNTNNNNAWYIRNGGTNSATLQFGLGASPGSSIKHAFNGDGSVSLADNLTISGQLDGVTNMFLGEYLYHQGDGDTYLNFQNADEFRIVVGGSEKLHFNTSRARINQHLYVASDSSYDLGTDAARFRNVYADTLYGDGSNLTGITASNADTVDNLHASSFIRSDAADTASGTITFTGGIKSPYVETTSTNQSLFLRPNGSGHVYLGDSGNGNNLYHYSTDNDGVYTTYDWNNNYYRIGTSASNGVWINDNLRISALDANGNADISGTLAVGQTTISSGSDNILTLNQTGTDTGWNYIDFETSGDRKWFIGMDENKNFDLYNDNINAYAITVGYTNNHINLKANTVVEGTLDANTLNTGQGDNELYAMNQNVRTTDDVTFDDLTVTGNLTITGDINSYNVTDLDVTDKTITVGVGQNASSSGSSGLIIDRSDSSNPSMLWNQTDGRFEFNSGVTVTGQLHTTGSVYAKGSLFVVDTDGTNNHIQARSNGTEGFMTVSNGSNWGLIMRGPGNDPRIGAYYGGTLKIEGFHSSDGATGANAVDFAQFQFGNDHFQMNAATSKFTGNITVGPSATTGGRILSQTYTSADRLGVISSHASSGNLLIGYGAEGKTSASGDFVSTYGNFEGGHSALSVSGTHLRWYSEASNSTTAVGSDLTLANVFSVDRSGNVALSGTVDGVDIATRDGVLTSTTTTANAALPKAGGAMTGNLTLNDNINLRFGTSGTESTIKSDGADTIMTLSSGSFMIGTNGGTPHDNSGKADFVVDVNAAPQISLYSNQVQVGSTDMNWNTKWNYDGSQTNFGAWNTDIHIFTQGSSGNTEKTIWIRPQGTDGTITTRAKFMGDTGNYLYGPNYMVSDGSNADGATLKLIHANNNTTDTIGTIWFGNNADNTLSHISSNTSGANNTSNLVFKTSNAGTLGTVLTLNADNSATFAGTVTANGTTLTGDQDLSGFVTKASAQTISGAKTFSSDITLDDDSGASPSLYLKNGDNNYWRIFNGSSLDLTFRVGTVTKFDIDSSGNGTFVGTVAASNFSGSSSGTNTGDQDLSSYITQTNADARYVLETGGSSSAMTGDLHIIAGAPKIYLQDNSDDDDHQIIFRNNANGDDYKITTQDFTDAGTGDGLFIGSESDDPVKLVTNDTIAISIDGSQNTTFAGNINAGSNSVTAGSFVGNLSGNVNGNVTGNLTNGSLSNISSLAVAGTVTVGADTSGHDVTFYGAATGEKMFWDSSESTLQIYHDTSDTGLEIFTVSSATQNVPQIKVGRNVNEYWGVNTNDRTAQLVHRQDETSGIMKTEFAQWDSNTSDTTGQWLWTHGAGDGTSMATALTLTQAGAATFAGAISASNFSGSSSGTNTGDQDISGIATNATAISNITSFPGFGTSSGTALEGDTTIPSGNQIIDWTAENAGQIHSSNISFPSDNNTFRTIKVDTTNNGTANETIGATEELKLIGGTAISLTENAGVVTINGVAETYTAHENISGATSSDNSGNTFIQDLTIDGNGHVTAVGTAEVAGFAASSHTHDDRYYTESEVDGFAVKLTGAQTIAGAKTFSSAIIANGGVAIQDLSDTTITRHSAGHIQTPLYRIFDDGYHPNADTLTTARTIAGVSFDGSANISLDNANITNGAGYITSFDITTQTDPKYIRSNASDNVTSHTEWQDDAEVRFGNSNDMSIYHTGGNNYFDANAGHLYIRANVDGDVGSNVYIRPHDNEEGIVIEDDAGVKLYYNNSQKMNTTSGGISVTGTVSASSTIGNKGTNIGQQIEYGSSSVATLRCDADRWRVYFGGGGQSREAFSVLETGNAGIGDSTPSYKLDVAGTIRATGDVIAYSDERVKENIKTIDNSLEKVNKLRGVEFNKIGEDKKSIGVIAQEIEKILPEVVRTDDEGMKSVAYGNVVGVLIEAVKELTKEVEELKKCNKCKNCNCNG